MLYALLDSNGLCLNRITWDGESDWQTPEGTTLIEDTEMRIGARYELVDDAWTLIPESEPEPPAEPRWVQFGAELATDTAVNTMIATAASTAPVLHLMLGVGLGQAAQGDPQTFSVAWANARAVGLVSAELAAHVATVGAGYDLPAEFLAQLEA